MKQKLAVSGVTDWPAVRLDAVRAVVLELRRAGHAIALDVAWRVAGGEERLETVRVHHALTCKICGVRAGLVPTEPPCSN